MNAIKEFRQTYGISAKKLAESLGVSRQAIHRYELPSEHKYKVVIPVKHAKKLVDLSNGNLSLNKIYSDPC